MKKTFAMLFCLALLTTTAFGQELNPGVGKHKSKDKDHDNNGVSNFAKPGGSGNLVDHGGEVMTNAKVVYIFWGWASTTTDNYVKEIISFRDDPNAMMKHIGMLSQYRSTGSTSLKGTQADVYDAVPMMAPAPSPAAVRTSSTAPITATATA